MAIALEYSPVGDLGIVAITLPAARPLREIPGPLVRRLRLPLAGALLLIPLSAHAQEVRGQEAGGQDVGVRVELSGVDQELRTNIELLTGIADSRSVRRSESHVLRLHDRAPEQIAGALEPFGYYRVTVNGELDTEGSTWTARYAIDPGPPMLIGTVDLRIRGEGERDSTFQALTRHFPLAAGDTLRHPDYEQAKTSIARLAAERGYLDAAFDSSVVLVDLDAYSSEVVLHFTTGPRFQLGEVTFVQDVVDDHVLRPFVRFAPGDEYEAVKLRDLQSDLAGTTYFSSIELRPRRDLAQEDRIVPIEIEASPRKTQRYEIGVGASSDTGVRIRLTAEFRRLNRFGHFASGDFRLAERDRSLTGRYNIPVGLPNPAVWIVSAHYGTTNWTTSTTTRGMGTLSFAHLRGKLREVLSVGYAHDDFTVGPDSGSSDLTTLVGAWTLAIADNTLLATRGFGAVLDARGAVEGVGSSASVLRGQLDLKWIRSLTDRFRYTLRASIGAVATNDFRSLPPGTRFFAGGDRSIRGYAYYALGPIDPVSGEVIGGNSLLVGSTEFEYRILSKWMAAIFVDGGNALRDFKGDLALGGGLGVRWISPVGLIRFDWAYGFQAERGRIHLVIGPDF